MKNLQKGAGKQIWALIMLAYLFLLIGISFIAFWEQDFNNPDKFLIKFENLRELHYQVNKNALGEPVDDRRFDDFDKFVNKAMESASNASEDLQDLATQSFNVVLGSFIAFLSAATSIAFQSNRSGKNED